MSILPFAGGLENSQNGLLVIAALAAIYYLLRPADAFGNRWAALKTILKPPITDGPPLCLQLMTGVVIFRSLRRVGRTERR